MRHVTAYAEGQDKAGSRELALRPGKKSFFLLFPTLQQWHPFIHLQTQGKPPYSFETEKVMLLISVVWLI